MGGGKRRELKQRGNKKIIQKAKFKIQNCKSKVKVFVLL